MITFALALLQFVHAFWVTDSGTRRRRPVAPLLADPCRS